MPSVPSIGFVSWMLITWISVEARAWSLHSPVTWTPSLTSRDIFSIVDLAEKLVALERTPIARVVVEGLVEHLLPLKVAVLLHPPLKPRLIEVLDGWIRQRKHAPRTSGQALRRIVSRLLCDYLPSIPFCSPSHKRHSLPICFPGHDQSDANLHHFLPN